MRLRCELQDRCERWVSFLCCSRDFFCTTLHARALSPLLLRQQMQQQGLCRQEQGYMFWVRLACPHLFRKYRGVRPQLARLVP